MKALQKILSILIIIVLMTTDFSVLGIGLKSYAADNTENVEFSAYFKSADGTKVEKINQEVTKQDLKLQLTIAIKNEGYFNGKIRIEDSNFEIDTEQQLENERVAKVEKKAIELKQINAGEVVNIELPIKITNAEEISTEMLSKEATLKLEGTYMKAKAKETNVETTRKVVVNIVPSEEVRAEVETGIITNIKTLVGEENKRVIQLYVKTRIANNEYPVKKTEINIKSPFNGTEAEKVEVVALKTKATNNEDTKEITNVINSNGKITFSIENKENENKIIKWKKEAWDEFVVTLIYDENIEIENEEIENYNKIKTEADITLYNKEEKEVKAENETEINEEKINSILVREISSKTEMYKGRIYANITSQNPEEIPYMDTTTIYLTEADIINSIVLTESEEKFITSTEELSANGIYKTTQVNKAQVLDILGEDGELSIIYDGNIFTVNKDTEANGAGNIVLTYDDEISKIGVITTNPVKAGKIDFIHTKVLKNNQYTREQLQQVTSMKNSVSITGIQGEKEIIKDTIERNIELKETETKAELTIVDNKGSLSTLKENKIVLGVKLVTDGEQYDLFKNPIMLLQLPEEVEDFELTNADKLYAEGFEITTAFDKENRQILLILDGEQTDYPETLATQIYLQLELTIKLYKTAPSKLSKIEMQYMNDNATKYENNAENINSLLDLENDQEIGYTKQEIEISAPSGIVSVLNSKTYNIETMTMDGNADQTIEIPKIAAGMNVGFDLEVINNGQEEMKNVKIEVLLPAGETDIDNLKAKLNNIKAEGAQIYYTKNANATLDLTNAENGWTSELQEDSKKVILLLDNPLEKGTKFTSTLDVTLPEEIPMNVETELKYRTIYDTDTEKDKVSESKVIKIVTPKDIKIEASISAQIGNVELKNGDNVKNGSIVKYTISVKNNGTQTIRNIVLKGDVPEGTELINSDEETTFTIDELKAGEICTKTYEVKISGKVDVIKNKTTAICDNVTNESNEIINNVEESKIGVKLSLYTQDSRQNGSSIQYLAEVTNLTNEEIKDVELIVNSNGLDLKSIETPNEQISTDLDKSIKISSIPANATIYIGINGIVNTESDKITTSIILKDKDGNLYNSNEIEENVLYEDADIELICTKEDGYVQQGESFVYQIQIKNTGTKDVYVDIADQFSNYLIISTIEFESNEDYATISPDKYKNNNLQYSTFVAAGDTAIIQVMCTVNIIMGEQFENKEIVNSASMKINGKEKKTKELRFYIKGIEGENFNTDDDNKNNNGNNDNSQTKKYTIAGIAWLDENADGIRDDSEKVLSGINVKVYDISTNNYLKDTSGEIIKTSTNAEGRYVLEQIPEGEYILLFEYDSNEYELTAYKAQSFVEGRNSSVVLKTISIDGNMVTCGVTDTLNVDGNISNINIGLKIKPKFDLELNKYVKKVVVQNNKGTKSYDFDNKTFAKVEIDRKQLNNSTIVIEYNIQVKNTGDIDGYASTIIDYMPESMTFKSELNSDWYIANGKLYTKQLENVKLKPGESKEISLILTKQMNDNNVGLINNIAEIYEDYNEYGISDIDSKPNNKINNEDDLGTADVYVGIKTGITMFIYIILVIINIILIVFAIVIIARKNYNN